MAKRRNPAQIRLIANLPATIFLGRMTTVYKSGLQINLWTKRNLNEFHRIHRAVQILLLLRRTNSLGAANRRFRVLKYSTFWLAVVSNGKNSHVVPRKPIKFTPSRHRALLAGRVILDRRTCVTPSTVDDVICLRSSLTKQTGKQYIKYFVIGTVVSGVLTECNCSHLSFTMLSCVNYNW